MSNKRSSPKKKPPPPGLPVSRSTRMKKEKEAMDAVEARKEARRLEVLNEQRVMLKPKLGEKKWEDIKVKAGGRERIRSQLTCPGVVLWEVQDCEGLVVDLRFFPYNALNGKFIQKSLGKLEGKERKQGEIVVKDAGKLTVIFKNEGSWFGNKKCKFRFVHASELNKDTLKGYEQTYAPQDVWWARRDPKTNRVYFINKHLKKTSWSLPPGAHVANAKYAKDAKKPRTVSVDGDESASDAEIVHGNEYQQRMNSITKGATMADLPPPLTGWFLKANRKGKLQSRYFRLERQYLHYYDSETSFHNDEECKDPMDLYAVVGTMVPSENEGFEDFNIEDIHDCPFDVYTRDKILSLVPDTTWFKCKITSVHPGGLYDLHFENGDNEEKVQAKMIRKQGEEAPIPQQTFKRGDKVEKQKNIRAARTLARVLKTWKPRIMSGWFMKVNRKGKQQKRWFHLLGTKLSYFKNPQDTKQKKEPLNLEWLDSVVNPSTRVKNASKLGAFDLIFATNKKDIPQSLEEKRKVLEADQKAEAKGVDEKKLTFQTITLYPAQKDPSTTTLVQILNDWQTHDELRFNKDKINILDCKIRAHPATAFGLVVTDVDPYVIDTGYKPHKKQGVRITQLLSLPNGELGPAEEAGVMLNDTLVSIDGVPVTRVQDAAKALKGKQFGTFKLMRLGDVNPEHINRMKRSMMTKEELEAEKTFKMKGQAAKRRKSIAAKQEIQKQTHRHRRHRGKKATFGPLKHRAGWRQATNSEGKIYWFHTNGSFTFDRPPQSQMLETMLVTTVVKSYSTQTTTTTKGGRVVKKTTKTTKTKRRY